MPSQALTKSKIFDLPEIKKIEKELEKFVYNQYREAAELTAPFLLGRGKKLRPILTVFCSSFYRPFQEKTLDVAIAAELIHTASLIHDDIVDNAKTRRGIPTINYKEENQVAVLSGDYLFAKAFELLTPYSVEGVLKIMASAVREMSQGEIFQLKNLYNTAFSKDDYFYYIKKKTGSLMAACCESGALMGEAPENGVKALHSYGLHLGVAFQVIDDLLDFTVNSAALGKATQKDLRQGKITLPVIYLLESSHKKKKEAQDIIENRDLSRQNLEYITRLLYQSGAISSAYLAAHKEVSKALTALNEMPETSARHTLAGLANYILERIE